MPSIDRAMVKISLYDICDIEGSHMTRDMVETIKRNCLPHEMKTRVYGEDMQGRGSVFDVDEADIVVPPFSHIPLHWRKIWGIDPGIFHAFGAVLLLHDVDNDIVYVAYCVRMRDAIPATHARPMLQIGAAVRVAYPKDAADRQHGDGKQLIRFYRDTGLLTLPDYAKWADGTNFTEPGIMEIRDRMKSGRFKVFNTQTEWLEEFRGYHRNDQGQIVKIYDDLMSATRVAIMSLRFATAVPLGGKAPPKQTNAELNTEERIRERCDFDIFG